MSAYRVRNAVTGRLVRDAVTLYPRTFETLEEAEHFAAGLRHFAAGGDSGARYEVVVFEAWLSQGDLA